VTRPATFQASSPTTAEVLIVVVATAGGLAKHLYESFNNQEPFRFWIFLAKTFTSGFSGWTFAHAARLFVPEGDFIVVCAAVGGWLGAEAMAWVIDLVRQKLGGPSSPA